MDAARLAAQLPDVHVECHERLSSTNDRGLEAAKAGEAPPRLIVAQQQTQGRGRGANRWWSSRGSLTFTLVIDAEALGLAPTAWPKASLAVGLAVCEVIESLGDRPAVRLKWPNDVFLDEAKVCGVLVETSARPPRLIVGVGVNVNNPMHDAPEEVSRRAISLAGYFDQEFDRVDVLVRTVEAIRQRLGDVALADAEVLAAWRSRCLLTQRHVEVDTPAGLLQGRCLGLDSQGALQLQDDSGAIRTVHAGVVQRYSGPA